MAADPTCLGRVLRRQAEKGGRGLAAHGVRRCLVLRLSLGGRWRGDGRGDGELRGLGRAARPSRRGLAVAACADRRRQGIRRRLCRGLCRLGAPAGAYEATTRLDERLHRALCKGRFCTSTGGSPFGDSTSLHEHPRPEHSLDSLMRFYNTERPRPVHDRCRGSVTCIGRQHRARRRFGWTPVGPHSARAAAAAGRTAYVRYRIDRVARALRLRVASARTRSRKACVLSLRITGLLLLRFPFHRNCVEGRPTALVVSVLYGQGPKVSTLN